MLDWLKFWKVPKRHHCVNPSERDAEVAEIKQTVAEERHELKNRQIMLIAEVLKRHREGRHNAV